ncbi:MAG: serine hydrolase [Vulcanimicrobiaceae bacterium]
MQAGLGTASAIVDALDRPAAIASVRPDADIYPASMIKFPIAMVLAGLCEANAYAWTDEATVDASCVTTNDAPSPFVCGYRADLATYARAMLASSDNVATNVLIDVLGRETITAACAAFGLRATAVHYRLSGSLPLIDDPAATGRNRHSAADAAALLGMLARRTGPGMPPDHVYDALAAQVWNDKLARGLQPGDEFAHKTGDTDEVSHDGGILTLPGGRRFVVVVYTPLPSCPDTDDRLADFMRALRPTLDDAEYRTAR